MRLMSAIRQDVRFQVRHRFYMAYLVMTMLYIAILWFVPVMYKGYAVTFIVFSDPCGLGFFFVGGLILLERDQNIINALFVTPLRVHEYIWAKVLSLTLLAVVTSVMIASVGLGFGQFRLGLLIVGIILSAICFTLLGITLAIRVKTVNQYFIGSALYSVFFLPLLNYTGLIDVPWLNLLPTAAVLDLLSAALLHSPVHAGSFFLLIGWIGIAFWWAQIWFKRYIIWGIGE